MASAGNNFNSFPQNKLNEVTKISVCSLNNEGKQGLQNKLKSGGTNNLQAKRAEYILNCSVVRRTVTLSIKNFPTFRGKV